MSKIKYLANLSHVNIFGSFPSLFLLKNIKHFVVERLSVPSCNRTSYPILKIEWNKGAFKAIAKPFQPILA